MHFFLKRKKKSFLTKSQHLWTLKFYSFWLKHCGKFVYSFEVCNPNLCRDVSDILKLCIRFDIKVFLCPRDDSQGALRFAPVCPSVCLSVWPSGRPSVRHALRYRVCVINSSHSFLRIFLKPCIPVVDILKMCMWVFGGARINFDRITAF